MKKQHENSQDKAVPLEQTTDQHSMMTRMMPWLAGVGFAIGGSMTSAGCTVATEGKCSGCGGCAVALGSMVVWALKKQSSGKEFYLDEAGQAEFDQQNHHRPM